MRLQDVMLRAMAKRITWYQAAEILGMSGRQMLRWQTRFKHEGYEGLFDRRRGVPSPKRVPVETVETVLRLYQEQYFDFNVRHFHEKLAAEHDIKLSYTWVKAALQGAGLVKARKHRGKHRKRRPRRPLPGMLLHIDGSQHRWFCDDRWYDLLVIMDDATSEVYYAQLVEEESTGTVMAGLRAVIEEQGVFCALYSDRASHFFLTPKAGEPVDHHRLTQVGRALRELGIQMIPAYSPQARGRSERGFSTWQGRLPPELRAQQIKTLEQANRFSVSNMCSSSISVSVSRPVNVGLLSCRCDARIWTWCSRCNTSVSWPAIIRSVSPTRSGSSSAVSCGRRSPVVGSPFMSIWTKTFRSPLVHIWLVATTRRPGPSGSRPRLWKWWKSHAKKRPDFPTHSHSHY